VYRTINHDISRNGVDKFCGKDTLRTRLQSLPAPKVPIVE